MKPSLTISEREYRIRARIDTVRDERDAALKDLWDARDEIEKLEKRIDGRYKALSEVKRSRDMWRSRAEVAEKMLNDIQRRKRGVKAA